LSLHILVGIARDVVLTKRFVTAVSATSEIAGLCYVAVFILQVCAHVAMHITQFN